MNFCPNFDVLLAMDNSHDAELALRAWRRCDPLRRVVRVKNGREALDLLQTRSETIQTQRPPSFVVLLDWKLPLIDGPEVLRSLRADERTCNLPVIVLTTCPEENELIERLGLGVGSYIVKPVEPENLSAAWMAVNASLSANPT
jgi:CheY-like chemotaxis protein